MDPSGYGYNKKCGNHRGGHYGEPLLGDEAETAHQPDTGGYEEESEIFNEEIRHLIDPHQPHKPEFESRGQKKHAYYTRWNREAGKINDEFAQR